MSETCQFWVRDVEGRLVRCGAPARWRTPRGMDICDEHHRQRQEALERIRARARSTHTKTRK